MFNQYSSYTYAAQNFANACDDKILVDINRLNTINDFDEVVTYVTKVFGEISEQKIFKYPNEVQVIVRKEANMIMVGAAQNRKEIFGKAWKLKE